MVMALGFVISSFQSVPSALLQKDLRYKLISIIELAKTTSTALVMLPLAFLGARYWTLVAGSLVGGVIATGLTLARKRHRFAMPDLGELGHAIKYSWQVLIGRIGWYTYSNSDFLVAGRVLGPVILGYYTLAWNLATMPIDKITTLVFYRHSRDLFGCTGRFFRTKTISAQAHRGPLDPLVPRHGRTRLGLEGGRPRSARNKMAERNSPARASFDLCLRSIHHAALRTDSDGDR